VMPEILWCQNADTLNVVVFFLEKPEWRIPRMPTKEKEKEDKYLPTILFFIT